MMFEQHSLFDTRWLADQPRDYGSPLVTLCFGGCAFYAPEIAIYLSEIMPWLTSAEQGR